MKKSVLIFCLFHLVSVSLMYAQELTLLTTAGGLASNNDMHLSYSIGEPVIAYVPNGTVWLTQGYQQPGHLDIMVSTDASASRDYLQLYPNPAQGEITITGFEPGQCDVLRLHNPLGQIVLITPLRYDHHQIRIDALQPGLYFVTIQCNNVQFQTTSFIKL